MKTPLQITFRDSPVLPLLEPEIRRRVDRFDRWTRNLTSCHVAVESEDNRRHQGQVYRVRVSVRLAGGEIVAGEHLVDEDVYVVMRDSFDVLDRQLMDQMRRRRGQASQPQP